MPIDIPHDLGHYEEPDHYRWDAWDEFVGLTQIRGLHDDEKKIQEAENKETTRHLRRKS